VSPRSSRDGIHFDVTYNVDCVHCGLVGTCPRYDVKNTIQDHYARIHPKVKEIVEERDFKTYEAPMRCDVCNGIAERPYWEHISDPPTSEGGTVDSDGRWLVCDACHDCYVRRDVKGIVRRHWANAKAQTPGLVTPQIEAAVRAHIAKLARLLFERWDEGTRDTLDNPRI
jgi:hypothetical protein